MSSDELELVLSDHDPARPIKIPPKGAELSVMLGYDRKNLLNKGLFICDEVEISGWPGKMTIRARAAPYDSTLKGKKDL